MRAQLAAQMIYIIGFYIGLYGLQVGFDLTHNLYSGQGRLRLLDLFMMGSFSNCSPARRQRAQTQKSASPKQKPRPNPLLKPYMRLVQLKPESSKP